MNICYVILFFTLCSSLISIFDENKIINKLKTRIPNYAKYLYVSLFFLILFITIFRSPEGLSADYFTYQDIFRNANNSLTFLINKFPGNDIGFLLLNKALRLFTDNFHILLLLLHFTILFSFFNFIKKFSKNIWLSILLLVTIGGYYISFNLIRQFLAISLTLYLVPYLINRNFIKYLIGILLISLIHKSVLLLIPFYFISNINYFNLLEKKYLVIIGILFLLLFLNVDLIIEFVQKIVYSNYTSESFGMERGSILSIARPSLYLFLAVINAKNIKELSKDNLIFFNMIIFLFLFAFLSLRLAILSRICYYFLPYGLCLIPNLIESASNKKRNIILCMIMVTLYALLTQYGIDYYFVWSW